jgi:hypothetical protein
MHAAFCLELLPTLVVSPPLRILKTRHSLNILGPEWLCSQARLPEILNLIIDHLDCCVFTMLRETSRWFQVLSDSHLPLSL